MKPNILRSSRAGRWLTLGTVALALPHLTAQDWPQWRGPQRDGHAPGFQAPAAWPKTLTPQWKVTVGEGVATPALVGERLYVFSREEGREVLRCLEAATGKELWQNSYESLGATGPAQSFSGPRSSPAMAAGKVVTVGVRGVISCLDAATGQVLWRKDDFKAWPNFFVSSSPLIVGDLCLAQLGGRDNGALVAYDLASGVEKWRCPGAPAYASPVLMTVGGEPLVVVQTESKLQAVALKDGQVAGNPAPPSLAPDPVRAARRAGAAAAVAVIIGRPPPRWWATHSSCWVRARRPGSSRKPRPASGPRNSGPIGKKPPCLPRRWYTRA